MQIQDTNVRDAFVVGLKNAHALENEALSIMNRPGIDHLKLSRMNFMGMGPWMMKRLARQHGVASPGELLTAAQAMGVKLLPCQMSMDLMGFTNDDLIDGLEEPVGAATVLQLIASGTPAIFI